MTALPQLLFILRFSVLGRVRSIDRAEYLHEWSRLLCQLGFAGFGELLRAHGSGLPSNRSLLRAAARGQQAEDPIHGVAAATSSGHHQPSQQEPGMVSLGRDDLVHCCCTPPRSLSVLLSACPSSFLQSPARLPWPLASGLSLSVCAALNAHARHDAICHHARSARLVEGSSAQLMQTQRLWSWLMHFVSSLF